MISKSADKNGFEIAEALFNEALEYSTHQRSKSLSLRIAINIINIRNEQKTGKDKIEAAYSILSSCLSNISEGNNTTDIITAQTIMDNRHSNSSFPV